MFTLNEAAMAALSFLWEKLAYEVEYTDYSDKWTMYDKWYTITDYPNVDFFAMDTTRLVVPDAQTRKNFANEMTPTVVWAYACIRNNKNRCFRIGINYL